MTYAENCESWDGHLAQDAIEAPETTNLRSLALREEHALTEKEIRNHRS
jgi:hypothetical protein